MFFFCDIAIYRMLTRRCELIYLSASVTLSLSLSLSHSPFYVINHILIEAEKYPNIQLNFNKKLVSGKVHKKSLTFYE